ncbi:C-_U-editing enzyme APOBEC-1, partial [Calypte anna]
ITWYLSWSPCACCCCKIQDFLKMNSYVNTDIDVAQLYGNYQEQNCQGLKNLKSLARVTIAVMRIEDKISC